ncbi:MAG: dipicolinate synthase [Clostridia bacterium]|nr:dipicolinate synthase [Clostridia bacterium]
MNINDKIAVIGGDARMRYCALYFGRAGFETAVYAEAPGSFGKDAPVTRAASLEDALGGADHIILGIPALPDGININTCGSSAVPADILLSGIRPEAAVAGGMIPDMFRSRAEKRGIKVIDYGESEKLAILNAVPTAEGAIAAAMKEMTKTLWKSRALVLGYGRVGSALGARLKALGSDVTVAARRAVPLAKAEAEGFGRADIYSLAPIIGGFDVIFNTVPAVVIGDEESAAVSRGTPIIDLASKPGGVDISSAEKYGLNVVSALSLPGKAAPETAGELIAETVADMLSDPNRHT